MAGQGLQTVIQTHLAKGHLRPRLGVSPGQTERDVAPDPLPRQQARVLEYDGPTLGRERPQVVSGPILGQGMAEVGGGVKSQKPDQPDGLDGPLAEQG